MELAEQGAPRRSRRLPTSRETEPRGVTGGVEHLDGQGAQGEGVPLVVEEQAVHLPRQGEQLAPRPVGVGPVYPGIPTSGILLPPAGKLLPPNGVYYAAVRHNGKVYKAISNVGTKPTVSSEKVMGVESYLYDFDQDIYGQDGNFIVFFPTMP